MFRVRNQMPGPYNLILERGSITIGQGKSFDIEGDGKCSREWIKTDPFFRRALDEGHIALVHDSEKRMAAHAPTGPARAAAVKPAPKKKPKPKIIDFGKGDDLPPEDLDEESAPVETEPEEAGPFEDLEPVDSEPEEKVQLEKPAEQLPDVRKDKKADLLEWAMDKNLDLPDDPTKTQIKDAIKASSVYQDLKEAWDKYKDSLEE